MAKEVCVLELYSGIGGMHCALKESGIAHKVVAAYDVNTNANKIYHHNFPESTVIDKGIEGITVKVYDKLNVDMILMSPPCQPFTRVGRQQDTDDARTNSFLHILDLLSKVSKLPSYLLVENVKGFETSQARERLISMLQQCQYKFQEFLLTPLQFGIPNSRLRYFLIAKRSPLKFGFTTTSEVQSTLPPCAKDWLTYRKQAEELAESCQLSVPTQGGPCQCGGYLHSDSACTDSQCAINELGAKASAKTTVESEVVGCRDRSAEETTEAKRRKLDNGEIDCDVDKGSETSDTNTNAIVEPSAEKKAICDRSVSISDTSNVFNTMVDAGAVNNVTSVTCDTNAKVKAIVDNSQICNTSPTMCKAKSKSSNSGGIANRNCVAKTEHTCQVQDTADNSAETAELSAVSCLRHTKPTAELSQVSATQPAEPRVELSPVSGTQHVCLESYGSNLRQTHEDQPQFGHVLKLKHFLEDEGSAGVATCMLQDKDLKRFMVMDIVNPCSTKTTCFTKRYGRFMEGAGSIVQGTKDAKKISRAERVKSDVKHQQSSDSWTEDQMKAIRDLGLRYFTPREIACLMGFPDNFGFPESLTSRQLYMALGNSLNVHVVSVLLKLMTFNDLQAS